MQGEQSVSKLAYPQLSTLAFFNVQTRDDRVARQKIIVLSQKLIVESDILA